MDELLQLLLKREAGIDPSNALREIHNAPHLDENGLPPTPSMFQPDPTVVGPPELGKLVKEMLRRSPNLVKRVKEVRMGPNSNVIGMLAYDPSGNSFLPEDYPDLNLLGMADPERGEVSLNPRLAKPDPRNTADQDLASTLSHELAHMAGANHRGTIRPGLEKFPEIVKRVNERNRLSADRAGELQMLLQQRQAK